MQRVGDMATTTSGTCKRGGGLQSASQLEGAYGQTCAITQSCASTSWLSRRAPQVLAGETEVSSKWCRAWARGILEGTERAHRRTQRSNSMELGSEHLVCVRACVRACACVCVCLCTCKCMACSNTVWKQTRFPTMCVVHVFSIACCALDSTASVTTTCHSRSTAPWIALQTQQQQQEVQPR